MKPSSRSLAQIAYLLQLSMPLRRLWTRITKAAIVPLRHLCLRQSSKQRWQWRTRTSHFARAHPSPRSPPNRTRSHWGKSKLASVPAHPDGMSASTGTASACACQPQARPSLEQIHKRTVSRQAHTTTSPQAIIGSCKDADRIPTGYGNVRRLPVGASSAVASLRAFHKYKYLVPHSRTNSHPRTHTFHIDYTTFLCAHSTHQLTPLAPSRM